jgi:type IV secretory pathway TraG/TraD family ATPase VirD4
MRIWDGVPFGFEDSKPLAHSDLAATCILGPPESGKTTEVTCNYLLDEPGEESFLVLCSKNTVRAITESYRCKVCGPENVFGVNPENLLGLPSAKWNPMKLDPEAPDYEERVVLLATNCIPETNEKQPHFALAARSGMALGIIVKTKEAARTPGAVRTLHDVLLMWTQEPDELRKMIKELMKSRDPAITTRAAKFLADNDEVENCKATIQACLGSWLTANMAADMATNEGADCGACRDRATTIYMSLSTESLVYKHGYFALFLGTALSELYKKPGLKTTLIIEEGFACGRLDILERTLATAREMKINIVIVYQFVSQIKQLYPASWKQFLSGAVLAYRAGEGDTAQWMSERAGSEWRVMASASDPSSPADLGPRPSYSLQKVERIPAGSMYSMPKGTALAWLPGDDAPRMVTMRGYYHPKLRKLGRRASPNPLYTGKPGSTGGGAWRAAAMLVLVTILAGLSGAVSAQLHALLQ